MNLTPPSASADNEQLREKIIGSLSRAQVQNVDVMGEATIEREADHIMRLVSLHTKEAVERGAAIIADLYDEDDCSFDHHGYCQAHGWFAIDPKCPHQRAKEYLSELATPTIHKTDMEGSAADE